MTHPVDRAVKESGLTVKQFAEKLQVTRAAVQQWKNDGRRVPAEHCPDIERMCNGAVRCEELNDRVDWAYVRLSGASLAAARYD